MTDHGPRMLLSGKTDNGADESARGGLMQRLGGALRRTRSAIVDGVSGLFSARGKVDAELLEELEELLLGADVGVEATTELIEGVRTRASRNEVLDADALLDSLRSDMLSILEPVTSPLVVPRDRDAPFIILVVGVNGAGKTTTIGKLAHRFRGDGYTVMVAAGDTFRAAAIEQLREWGERVGVPVVAQHTGADAASVVYDACTSARARGVDVLITDTAGRLHTQAGLMDELKKVRRVVNRLDDNAPHEILLVLDAGTGQNALAQAAQFGEAVGLTGVALTKLDGTARGGVLVAIAKRLALPVRFIGVGEKLDDLRVFDARDFVDAILRH